MIIVESGTKMETVPDATLVILSKMENVNLSPMEGYQILMRIAPNGKI